MESNTEIKSSYTLSNAEKLYLEGASGEYDEKEREMLIHLAGNHERTNQEISSLINELRGFTVTLETATKPLVRRGLEEITSFSQKIAPELSDAGASLLVYGSMQYDDPPPQTDTHKSDFDLVVFTNIYDPKIESLTSGDWIREMNNRWDTIGGAEGHITYATLSHLMGISQEMQQRAEPYTESDILSREDLLSAGAVALIGNPIFNPSPILFSNAQLHIRKFITESPLMTAIVHKTLSDTLNVRKERRSIS